MSSMIPGVIHGRTIQLDHDPGIGDGQVVEVTVRVLETAKPAANWGDGLRRCAGSLADRPDLDASLEEILRERKSDGRREVDE